MPETTGTGNKRKCSYGVNMPLLLETIDDETGETYHVETTRQAKRRHLRNARAPPQPTAGQINAADIWNRQQEKIKKDKERDEKRKRNKARQESREDRLKEIQDERLKEGRICIEDTWGKVNASQNRIHKFFGAPRQPHRQDLQARVMAPPPKPSASSPPTPKRTQAQNILKQRCSPSAQHETCPDIPFIATQVVRDTLSGLCSQDFDDDLADDEKENFSPSPSLSSRKSKNKRSGPFESFCDDDIDDDLLLALLPSPQKHNRGEISQSLGPQVVSKLPSDSFAMDGITDNDLLQGLEDYEHDTEAFDDEELLECVKKFEKRASDPDIDDAAPQIPKKRRTLPWDKKLD